MKTVLIILFLIFFPCAGYEWDCFPIKNKESMMLILENFGGQTTDEETEKLDFNNDGRLNAIDLAYFLTGSPPYDCMFWDAYAGCPPKISWESLSSQLVCPNDLKYLNNGRLLISCISLQVGVEHPMFGELDGNMPVAVTYNIYTPWNITGKKIAWCGINKKPLDSNYGNFEPCFIGRAPSYLVGEITDIITYPSGKWFCGYKLYGDTVIGFIGQANNSIMWISEIPDVIPVSIYDLYYIQWKSMVDFGRYAEWANLFNEPKITDVNYICTHWIGNDGHCDFVDYSIVADFNGVL